MTPTFKTHVGLFYSHKSDQAFKTKHTPSTAFQDAYWQLLKGKLHFSPNDIQSPTIELFLSPPFLQNQTCNNTCSIAWRKVEAEDEREAQKVCNSRLHNWSMKWNSSGVRTKLPFCSKRSCWERQWICSRLSKWALIRCQLALDLSESQVNAASEQIIHLCLTQGQNSYEQWLITERLGAQEVWACQEQAESKQSELATHSKSRNRPAGFSDNWALFSTSGDKAVVSKGLAQLSEKTAYSPLNA